MEQHKGSQHVGHRCLLMRAHNAPMREAGCVQSKKICILGKHYAAILGSAFQMEHIPAACKPSSWTVITSTPRLRNPSVTAFGTCSSM